MKYVNEELKLSFEIDDDYTELDKNEIDFVPGTLFVFENTLGSIISLNIDYGNGDDYEDIIQWNIDNLKNAGLNIIKEETIEHEGRRIDIVISEFEKLMFYTCFTPIHGNVITSSIEMEGNAVEDLMNVFKSMKEL